MKVKPLGDRLLVKRVEPEEVKKGGIIIPDTAKEKPQEAEVIEVGTGKKDEDGKSIKMDVKKGDKILISKWGGTEITLNDEEYLIIKEDDVLAIVS